MDMTRLDKILMPYEKILQAQERLRRSEKNVGFIFFDFGKRGVPLFLWIFFMLGLIGSAAVNAGGANGLLFGGARWHHAVGARARADHLAGDDTAFGW